MPLTEEGAKRRVRWDLDGGHMDICTSPDASPETVAALRDLGQAAVNHMKKEASVASTRCKFQCHSVMPGYGDGAKVVSLSAVYAPDDPESENGKFWTATPNGQISLEINNPDGAAIFEQGKSYYVDLTPVEA